MAVKVWDGFDHYKQTADLQSRSGFLQYGVVQGILSFVPGFNGGNAVSITALNANQALPAIFSQRVASAFIGNRVNFQGNYGCIFEFFDSVSATVQVSVQFNMNNFSIQIYRGDPTFGTLLFTTGNNVWSPNATSFIEIWPVIDPSTGSVNVWLNGVNVASITGVNTRNSANTWWDTLIWCPIKPASVAGSCTIVVDDLYYGDTTTGPGAHPCNTPLGDCGTYTVFPVGNDSVQFAPLASTNWQEVSEVAMDSDTTYNFDSTVGHEDRFNMGTLPATIALIYGVQVTGAYRKDDAGARSIKQGLKSGSTETYGSTYALGESNYVYYTDPWILDPNTSANWTLVAFNAAKAAYNVAA
jgi:hypothetical protein